MAAALRCSPKNVEYWVGQVLRKGAGCDFVLATRTKDREPSPALMAVRLGARYAVRGELTLVQARTVGEAPADRVVFPARETHPRLLVVHLGFAFLFGGEQLAI